jgi:hypothetical protein
VKLPFALLPPAEPPDFSFVGAKPMIPPPYFC